MESLKNKVTIITGASSGIGRATAILFSKYGAKLVLAGRNELRLRETRDECCQYQPEENILTVAGDVSRQDYRKNLVSKTIEKFYQINILINNAGILTFQSFENTTEDDFDSIVNTNVKSVMFLTQLCVPYLIAQQGTIVNVSSIRSTRCIPNMSIYCMSKAALDNLTRCLALELAPKQVRVNSVNPGPVQTNILMANNVSKSKEHDDKLWETEKKVQPTNRLATVEEVAYTIAYLASDQSSFVTGEFVHVAGGVQLV